MAYALMWQAKAERNSQELARRSLPKSRHEEACLSLLFALQNGNQEPLLGDVEAQNNPGGAENGGKPASLDHRYGDFIPGQQIFVTVRSDHTLSISMLYQGINGTCVELSQAQCHADSFAATSGSAVVYHRWG